MIVGSHCGSPRELVSSYSEKWRGILEDFYNTQCRCETTLRGEQCQNYRNLHRKGHQFNLGGDRIVLGEFTSTFEQQIDGLVQSFTEELRSNVARAFQLAPSAVWNKDLWTAAKLSRIRTILSNRTCLTCLSRTPIHVLPCNHSICDQCLTTLSQTGSPTTHILTLQRCPLSCQWVNKREWSITRKPPEAGVRLLSLDGYVHRPLNDGCANE
jgi:hypothetical protein